MTRTQINRAYDRAHDQARAGNTPTLTATRFDGTAIHETWLVTSRTHDGRTYRVELSHDQTGIETMCDCQAAERGDCCWHRGAARLAHQKAIASRNEAGKRFIPKPAATMSRADVLALSGKRAAS